MHGTVPRDYNQEAKSRPDKQYQYNFDHIVRDYMMRSFAPFFRPGSALEPGCYEGDTAVQLAKYFDDLTVVEASSDALAVAKARLPATVMMMNGVFEEVTLTRRFDNIFLINVLEHVEEAKPVLERARNCLAPNGRLFVLVPNADAPSRQIAVQMGLITHNNAVTPGEWEHGHRRTYSFDTLERDIREAGLRVVQRGGLLFKALANYQMDRALEAGIIDMRYIEGIYQLGMVHPAFCSSIYFICEG
jgi:2-polyprenyl-3-methyl-5-hydroxy-6-metoxy-1,4-benzoquinol methylase